MVLLILLERLMKSSDAFGAAKDIVLGLGLGFVPYENDDFSTISSRVHF